MKHTFLISRSLVAVITAALLTAGLAHAKQGATDPIPGTSNGAANTKSGGTKGGGGKSRGRSTTATPAPAPAPAPQPTITAPLAFSASGEINGVLPVCTGDYRIDPYYPTLLDMTVNVHVSSLNVADGTVLYVGVVGAGGTLYPYSSNAIIITGGSGFCTEKIFVTLGTTVAGVLITDAAGNVIFAGI